MQTLTHGQTHGADRVHTIVSAETTLTRNSKIYVWRHVASKCSCNSKHEHGKWYRPIEIIVQLITQLAMIIGMLVFLSQYFGIEVSSYSLNVIIYTHGVFVASPVDIERDNHSSHSMDS